MEIKQTSQAHCANPSQNESYLTPKNIVIAVGVVVIGGAFWWCGGPPAAAALSAKVAAAAKATFVGGTTTATTANLAGTAKVLAGGGIVIGSLAGSPSDQKKMPEQEKELEEKKSWRSQIKEAAWNAGSAATPIYGALTVKELENRYSQRISYSQIREEQKRSDAEFLEEIKNGCKGVTNYKQLEEEAGEVFERNPRWKLLHEATYQKCLEEVKARSLH